MATPASQRRQSNRARPPDERPSRPGDVGMRTTRRGWARCLSATPKASNSVVSSEYHPVPACPVCNLNLWSLWRDRPAHAQTAPEAAFQSARLRRCLRPQALAQPSRLGFHFDRESGLSLSVVPLGRPRRRFSAACVRAGSNHTAEKH
jgi:hypothetical protein